MTGAYLRVLRDGRWQNIEIEHLTEQERREAMKGRSAEELLRWLDVVCFNLASVVTAVENLYREVRGEDGREQEVSYGDREKDREAPAGG